MPRGQWKDNSGRSAAAKKAAAHRKPKARGPYGLRVLPPEVSARMRAIAERIGPAPMAAASDPLPKPGDVADRIDAFLGAMDARDREMVK